jgi:hypothetical protein
LQNCPSRPRNPTPDECMLPGIDPRQRTELMLNGAGAGGSATKTPFSSLWPGTHWGNAAAISPGMDPPRTGDAARNQFSGKVWLMKKEVIIRLVACLVVPVLWVMSRHRAELELDSCTICKHASDGISVSTVTIYIQRNTCLIMRPGAAGGRM